MAKNKSRPSSTSSSTKKKTTTTKNEKTVVETITNIEEPKKEETVKTNPDILKISFLVYYSSNVAVKLNSVKKYITLKEMLNEFIHNPKAFVGIVISSDYEMIKNYISTSDVILNYSPLSSIVKEKFLEWLNENTSFTVKRLIK